MGIGSSYLDKRQHLDVLFFVDAIVSFLFGTITLLTPHGLLQQLVGGGYNHDAHELFRLYGCLRIAMGWILFHVRAVDDGRLRRAVCEALFACYLLQAAAVLRAQLTDRRSVANWIAVALLTALGGGYGRFRFARGGNLIKVYELPQNSKTAI